VNATFQQNTAIELLKDEQERVWRQAFFNPAKLLLPLLRIKLDFMTLFSKV
jgi:hypothetical protein